MATIKQAGCEDREAENALATPSLRRTQDECVVSLPIGAAFGAVGRLGRFRRDTVSAVGAKSFFSAVDEKAEGHHATEQEQEDDRSVDGEFHDAVLAHRSGDEETGKGDTKGYVSPGTKAAMEPVNDGAKCGTETEHEQLATDDVRSRQADDDAGKPSKTKHDRKTDPNGEQRGAETEQGYRLIGGSGVLRLPRHQRVPGETGE